MLGGSIATGRASHATLVRDEDLDKEAIQSVLQDCWGLDVRLTTCSGKNIVTKSKEAMAGPSEIGTAGRSFCGRPWLKTGCCADDDDDDDDEEQMLHFDLSQRTEKRRLSHGKDYVYQ
jgi:hypothetical protein